MVKVLGDEDPAMRYSVVCLFCQSDNVLLAPPENLCLLKAFMQQEDESSKVEKEVTI